MSGNFKPIFFLFNKYLYDSKVNYIGLGHMKKEREYKRQCQRKLKNNCSQSLTFKIIIIKFNKFIKHTLFDCMVSISC